MTALETLDGIIAHVATWESSDTFLPDLRSVREALAEAIAERDEWWRTAERAAEELAGRPETDGDLALEMRDQQQLIERLWTAQGDLLETIEAQKTLLERAWRNWDTVWAQEYREEMDFTDIATTMEVIREHLDRDD